jgi:hypothetical protein
MKDGTLYVRPRMVTSTSAVSASISASASASWAAAKPARSASVRIAGQ